MTNIALIYDVFQYAVVGAVVICCAVYCVLALAPNAIKEPLRHALRRLPLPKSTLAKLSQPAHTGACGSSCGSCSAPATTDKKAHWHPRQR